MLLSAVSLGVCLLLGGAQAQQKSLNPAALTQLKKEEVKVWNSKMKSTFAVLWKGESPTGCAALIEKSGLFLAHMTTVPTGEVDATLSDGRRFHLRQVSSDTTTQLVLLKADNWELGGAEVVDLANARPKPGQSLLAALPSGPIRAELISSRTGVLDAASRRLLPLSEIRFEAPADLVGGALVYTMNGELMGVLNATLKSNSSDQEKITVKIRDVNPNAAKAFGNAALSQRVYGPGALTVAYTLDPMMMNRIVNDFRSPGHQVIHAVLGIYCKDAPHFGALITNVVAGSNAEKAGLVPGDVILKMDDKQIRDQVAFAYFMLNAKIGKKVAVQFRRNGKILVEDIEVEGKAFKKPDNPARATSVT